ncbi:MAG TPA: 3-demethylubiquinone-9 3-O-methyltransferase [Rhodospirillaceae bacterium]|nr:MAG: 3-demethylubiquinone-9 3-O-methyltransferase [Alphaproteobacteria bacterium GWF2_58_20]HAU29229.1 3-demethylubiquinone-9 3-O-methyltransferase [Rhodospirillaceae bacterium]
MFPFGDLAKTWWTENGPLDALRGMNSLRMHILARHLAPKGRMAGKSVLDVGCGGGMASEALARLGAHVTGTDPDLRLIRAARAHAAKSRLPIRYRHGLVENIAESFDLVLLLDVVEHVEDPARIIAQATRCLNPGGILALTSVSRNAFSWGFGILAAEYLLGWVPRGTHDWNKFRNPSDILPHLRACGLECSPPVGLVYQPTDGAWHEDPHALSGNWMIIATRPCERNHKHPRRAR